MILPFYQKDDLLPKNTPEDDISVIIEKGDIHPRKYGTAKPLDSGHVGSAQTCPLFGGVRCWEVLSNIQILSLVGSIKLCRHFQTKKVRNIGYIQKKKNFNSRNVVS